jgi:hypothetical protein
LGSASQSHAQVTPFAPATPIAGGHLNAGPTPATQVPSNLDLTFTLVNLPNGAVSGRGKLTNKAAGGWIQFNLTSYEFVGDTLYVAGPVTKTFNTEGVWAVGDTFFMGVNDNGNGTPGSTPDEFIEGGVPAAFGPLSVQQILAIVGPAPPEIFRQGISGNLVIQ